VWNGGACPGTCCTVPPCHAACARYARGQQRATSAGPWHATCRSRRRGWPGRGFRLHFQVGLRRHAWCCGTVASACGPCVPPKSGCAWPCRCKRAHHGESPPPVSNNSARRRTVRKPYDAPACAPRIRGGEGLPRRGSRGARVLQRLLPSGSAIMAAAAVKPASCVDHEPRTITRGPC